MSKILIDEETLYAVIDALNIGYLISSGKEQQRIFAERNKLLDEIQETKKHFSVLEWHHPELVEEDGKQFWIDIPDWEKCGKSEQVIAITKQGYLSAIAVEFVELEDDDGYCLSGVFPDGEDWEDYKAWAYLPE